MSRESFHGAVPGDRLYDPEHDMWVRPEDDGEAVRIGATAFGVHLAGKIIAFTAKPRGAVVETGRGMGTVECAKTIIAIHAPIGFELLAGNAAAEENPDLLNRDPYGAGWMVVVRPDDWLRDMGRLVDARSYRRHIRRIDPDAVIE
jgi:glycine cleavage system H protein